MRGQSQWVETVVVMQLYISVFFLQLWVTASLQNYYLAILTSCFIAILLYCYIARLYCHTGTIIFDIFVTNWSNLFLCCIYCIRIYWSLNLQYKIKKVGKTNVFYLSQRNSHHKKNTKNKIIIIIKRKDNQGIKL